MNNRGALIKNERSKFYRKAFTIIIIIIITLFVAFLFIEPILTDFLYKDRDYNPISYSNKEMYEQYIRNSEEYYDSGDVTGGDDLQQYYADRESQQLRKQSLAFAEYLLEHDISPTSWKVDVVMEFLVRKFKVVDGLNSANFELPDTIFNTKEDVDKYFILSQEDEEEIQRLEKIVENEAWREYVKEKIVYLNGRENINVEGSNESLRKEVLEMYLEMDIVPYPITNISNILQGFYYGEFESENWKSEEINKIIAMKKAVIRKNPVNNMNSQYGGMGYYTSIVMTHSSEKQMLLDIEISYLKLKENIGPSADISVQNSVDTGIGSIMMLVTMFGILIGASVFASEFSSGTIKLLVITPFKRKKIFRAKVRCVLEAVVGLAICMVVLGILIVGIYTKFEGIGSKTVVGLFGKAVILPSIVNTFIIFLKNLVPAIMYTLFAIMLSATLRKTAPSLALPMMVYVFSLSLFQGIVQTSANLVGAPSFLYKCMFFVVSNMNLHSYLGITFLFAFIVMGVTSICFYVIGKDSFCRRDIK